VIPGRVNPICDAVHVTNAQLVLDDILTQAWRLLFYIFGFYFNFPSFSQFCWSFVFLNFNHYYLWWVQRAVVSAIYDVWTLFRGKWSPLTWRRCLRCRPMTDPSCLLVFPHTDTHIHTYIHLYSDSDDNHTRRGPMLFYSLFAVMLSTVLARNDVPKNMSVWDHKYGKMGQMNTKRGIKRGRWR
jgi:hypothetical protein